ncbi:MAG: GNAT family N-acetyltransferase [Rhodobacteraceae bacterium]|nr:GNAT family N-acetyltransferase [Paracoccaceae bacterium]
MTEALQPVAPGYVAAVVTHLEMRAPAPVRPVPAPAGVVLRRVERPSLAWYRALFLRVGGQEWLWTSRLEMDDATLGETLADPLQEVWAVTLNGADEGLLELDFRTEGACELAFFGLTRALIGSGTGRWLMNAAIHRAWSRPIGLFHVHTCTFDHPGALSFYRRSGFVPVRQEIETYADPRLTGLLPADAGPHIPMFAP